MSRCISHSLKGGDFLSAKEKLCAEVREHGEDVEERLAIVDRLSEFPLGQYLICNRGADGEWIDYVIMYPKRKGKKELSELEEFILEKAPVVLATQERHTIFQREIQKRLVDRCKMASVPCGVFNDFRDIDFSNVTDFQLVGLDIDEESIQKSRAVVQEKGLQESTTFYTSDAWNMELPEQVDLIVSNGLSIYERDKGRLQALYKRFFENLAPGGTLITSCLTPPAALADTCEWKMDAIVKEDLLRQKILFADILQGKWQAFRSTKWTKEALQEAGFTDIKIVFDKASLFPTLIASKLIV